VEVSAAGRTLKRLKAGKASAYPEENMLGEMSIKERTGRDLLLLQSFVRIRSGGQKGEGSRGGGKLVRCVKIILGGGGGSHWEESSPKRQACRKMSPRTGVFGSHWTEGQPKMAD